MTLEELQQAIRDGDWRTIWVSAVHGEVPSEAQELLAQSVAPIWLKNLFGSRRLNEKRPDDGRN